MIRVRGIVPAAAALALAACDSQTGTADMAGEDTETADAVGERSAAAPASALEPNLAVEGWIKSTYPDMGPYLYRYARFDLDGDGTQEVLVYVGGRFLCGTGGCNLSILKLGENAFEKVTETSVTQLPVGVLETSTNGWRDLWVTTYGGGAPQEIKKLVFDGSSYPSNPTVPPAEATADTGAVLIEDGDLISIAD